MKYLIVVLIKGPASEYQQKLMYFVAKKFDLKGAIKRKPPTHITLKYSFEIKEISVIERTLKDFCSKNNKSNFKYKNFNHFDSDVIFMDVIPSKEMKACYKKFIDVLKKIKTLEFKQFDGTTHFHSTIAHSDLKPKFDEVWDYVSKKKVSFNMEMNNITILKLVKGVWKIHKEYKLD